MNGSPPELEGLLKERDRRRYEVELARRTFAGFVSYMRRDYIWSDFSRSVCAAIDDFLEAVQDGRRPVLVLQAPPQHGKSELVSRLLSPYIFGRWPRTRIAGCSYAADLAQGMNRAVQQLMMSVEYKEIFPEVWLNPKRVVTMEGQALRNSDYFDIVGHGGYYIAAGIQGTLTGKSVDIGIIDDPIKNEEEARSEAIKAKILAWYNAVFSTRPSMHSGEIIMATSWATDDLAATVVKTSPRAVHLKFPAINPDGTALVPELHPLEQLEEIRARLTPAQWAALYMQSPVIEGGNIFREEWIREWTSADLPMSWDELVQSWDLAFKDTKTSDFVVGQVWGRKGARYFLLDQVRGRMGFTDTVRAIVSLSERWPRALAKLVEDKANGPAVLDALRTSVPGLIPVNPEGSKLARAHSVTALWQAGNVYLPAGAPWRRDFDGELVAFPASSHDDQVDAMTQALRYFRTNSLAIWEALGRG